MEKLIKLFQELPGIGPRQAKRFIYSILEKDENFSENLASAVLELKKNAARCLSCFSFREVKNFKYTARERNEQLCFVCGSANRKSDILLAVEKDIDLENIEKSGAWDGKYFVLGGVFSPLKPESQKFVRFRELFERIKKDKNIKEVILATSATAEGGATALYIEKILRPFKEKGLKITRLGRGLSTGTEIEYSDEETIKNSLENRK